MISVGEDKHEANFSEISKSGKIVNAYNALLLAEKMTKKIKTLNLKYSYFDIQLYPIQIFPWIHLKLNAKIFIFFSSVKAVADELDTILIEETYPNPVTHYGKSKLLAEQYILSKVLPIENLLIHYKIIMIMKLMI